MVYIRSSSFVRLKNKKLSILSETSKRHRLNSELFVNINELEPFASHNTGENNFAVCILCGEPVIRAGNPPSRRKMHHIEMQHNEWVNAVYGSPTNSTRNCYHYDPVEPKTWKTCPNCGIDLKKQPFKLHKYKFQCRKCKSIFKSSRRMHKVPLKPWKDPESLFCDTKFLKDLLGKEPTKGNECKDVYEEAQGDEKLTRLAQKQGIAEEVMDRILESIPDEEQPKESFTDQNLKKIETAKRLGLAGEDNLDPVNLIARLKILEDMDKGEQMSMLKKGLLLRILPPQDKKP